MATEIERKFLVRDTSFLAASGGTSIRQGYLSLDPDRTVRVRIAGDAAFLTVKGRSDGTTRLEFEYAIPPDDAVALLALRDGTLVEKVRHRIEHAGRTWEVDVFGGENEGLVLAEVELPTADASVDLPPWAGREVTGDERYYNANLVGHPYRSWPEADRTTP